MLVGMPSILSTYEIYGHSDLKQLTSAVVPSLPMLSSNELFVILTPLVSAPKYTAPPYPPSVLHSLNDVSTMDRPALPTAWIAPPVLSVEA
mgnify:CR=1 FL=1